MKWVTFLRKLLRYGNYRVQRPLEAQEREHHLRIDQALPVIPSDHWTVIRMNECYLEVVDRHYDRRGFLTWGGLGFAGIALYALAGNTLATYEQYEKNILDLFGIALTLMIYLVFGFLFWLCTLIARAELGRWTHYPIRLNRKTRSVYVFGGEGEVRAVAWDKLFFTTMPADAKGCFTLMGHELDEQSQVVFSFALPVLGEWFERDQVLSEDDPDYLRKYWEFVRRYMQEGPSGLHRQVRHLVPLDGQRETVKESFLRFNENYGFLWLLALPLTLMILPFRVLVMKTSQVPVWPQWVEDECAVAPNDPYRLDKDHPPRGR